MNYSTAINVQCRSCGQIGLLYWEDAGDWQRMRAFCELDTKLPDEIETPFFECSACDALANEDWIDASPEKVVLL